MSKFSNVTFPEFEFARIKLDLLALDPIRIPYFPGSVFRGGLGAALRRICCSMNRKECRECMLSRSCIYARVFETASEHVNEARHKLSNYPRPFIIESPFPSLGPIRPGDSFSFGLILGGFAVQDLPYLIYAFQRLGKSGIGSCRGRYRVERVIGMENEIIFDGKSQRFTNHLSKLSLESIFFDLSPVAKLSLTFDTPTRIKFRSRLTKELTFELLMINLLRRISLMVEVCTGSAWKLDYKAILKKASEVWTRDSRLRWYDNQRYSKRQNDSMKLGGFLGTATFEGDLTPFVPFLRIGEYLHVGKQTSFGLGKYEMHFLD